MGNRTWTTVAIVLGLLAYWMIDAEVSVAGDSLEIDTSGIVAPPNPNPKNIRFFSRPADTAVVVSLEGIQSWRPIDPSSGGKFLMRWGVLDMKGNFIDSESEWLPELIMPANGPGNFKIDRAIFIPAPDKADGEHSVVVEVLISACHYLPAPVTPPAPTCVFEGKAQLQVK